MAHFLLNIQARLGISARVISTNLRAEPVRELHPFNSKGGEAEDNLTNQTLGWSASHSKEMGSFQSTFF
jgi:hypothetical protein